jgi:ABC-type transporter Mla maintaining outer membrane lipid asymmetry ATPase subunit MlaF
VVLMFEGNIVWEGTPEEGMKSSDPYMAQFASGSREGPMLNG